MLPNEHDSVWLGADPLSAHVPGPAYAGEIVQAIPEPPGIGSFNVAPNAVPAPALVTPIE
jgi:hypothetical protein